MDEKKKYGIFRIEKVKLCDGGEVMGRLKHAFREFNKDSFDPELKKQNNTFFFGTAKEVMKAYKDRVQSITTEKYKPPKNSVGIYECIFTSTAGAIPKEREKEFFELTYTQLCRTFGNNNVLAGAVHLDETTVHTHWFVTPIFNTTTILRRTKEEKEKGICRTITQPQLNATHWTGSPAQMSELQDIMWEGIFQHFGLARGEVELPSNRTKKKKNIRSDIRKREVTIASKEIELDRKAEIQKQKEESLAKKKEELTEQESKLLNKSIAFSREKADFHNEMEDASRKAVEEYEKLLSSKNFENGEFPSCPTPGFSEGVWNYFKRIRPIFDSIVSKAQYFFKQIKFLNKNHQEEIQKLKEEHKTELESVKVKSEAEKKSAIEVAVSAKAAEKDAVIDSLKLELQTEKGEKEKYVDKSKELDIWENRDGDELISIGNSYKRFNVHNWKDYIKVKSRARSSEHSMVW